MNTLCRYKQALKQLVDSIERSGHRYLYIDHAKALLASDGPCNPPDPFEEWWAIAKESNIDGGGSRALAKAAWDAATSNLKLDHISKQ